MLISFNQDIKEIMAQGITAHQQGRLADAEGLYRQVLGREPQHAEALHMLGLLAHQSGKSAVAMQLIEQSRVITPDNPVIYSNLAEIKRTLGLLAEAEALCRRALELDPNLSAAHINLALTLHLMRRLPEALEHAMRAVELLPQDHTAHAAAGMCLADLNRLQEAAAQLTEALRLKPNDAGVATTLGICYLRMEEYEQAYNALNRAVGLAPNNPQIVLNLATLYAHVEHFSDAISWGEKVLRLDPNFLPAIELMANVKTSNRDFEEAIEFCRRGLVLAPQATTYYAIMGEAMMGLGQFEETIKTMQLALTLGATSGIHQSLCNAYVRIGRAEEGLVEVEKAIAMDPNNPVLHFNKSVILLLMGRMEEAWPEYEWRWKHPRMAGRSRRFNRPQWDGTPLNGQRILLHAEQGLGDTVFFGRYATRLAEECGGVPVLWVQNSMVELMKTVQGVGEVVPESSPIPAFDVHLPIMSLPRIFNTTLETIPAKVPYISTDPVKKERWRKEFAQRTNKLKVGLVWEGGAFQPENFLRSASLAAYAPLGEVEGVAFFGLQKGPAEVQAKEPPPGMDFVDLSAELHDFTDTAAILDTLDLLISIDTSVVHIAGALAKPIWMLLAYSPGHMWMYEREDSPWYPTMRIFRQPAFKDWVTPIQCVKVELEKLAKSR